MTSHAAAPLGTDLCPETRFMHALLAVAAHLRPGTLVKAGGEGALRAHYREHFGVRPCRNRRAAPPNRERWPTSVGKWTAGHRQIIDLGDGRTGTRFLACITERVGLVTNHNLPTAANASDLTSFFDRFDAIFDSPATYLTNALLATHAHTATSLFLSLRDPWDWLRSRRSHHPRTRSRWASFNWTAATGGCAHGFTPLGAREASSLVARDLLTQWAWALCLAGSREPSGLSAVPVINLFDHEQCRSMRGMERVLTAAGRGVARATMEAVWFGKQCHGRAAKLPEGGCGPESTRRHELLNEKVD